MNQQSVAEPERHAEAEERLGTAGVAYRAVSAPEATAANLAWWDADADDYQAAHGGFLGDADFVWCPEGVREADVALLGEVGGKRILEVGCGQAACSRWLAAQGAHAVATDLSGGMLRHAREGNERTGTPVPLVQATAESLPFADASFDAACSAFGAVPFVASVDAVFAEVRRVLRPGARWVFSVTHPMRWIFPDDPGPQGLTVTQPYFDRTPYVEVDEEGVATYVEYHRTLGDYVRALADSGFALTDLIEPAWPEGHSRTWGQWSPLRGKLFPGTAIFCTQRG
ncbi:Methyltransferase domain-containing protein [Amycolatopsis lurida]|uniref:SAM-dependent methyltransferase n=1 Tax=Amycolatopsis lurida NRRL 2430 TaxID=1460371 RepID=A0A2P2FNM5_AMYLU|nr:class I SAM-dependent methyltransferase [Amycolatopsis lurida]KFU78321.1 SAM-dependent methyltransferase [Amycolatopsis lurida NRRL 2430]SEE59747.1 Methyltransferase domain-containing protein [Amycolatopsis lurida]